MLKRRTTFQEKNWHDALSRYSSIQGGRNRLPVATNNIPLAAIAIGGRLDTLGDRYGKGIGDLAVIVPHVGTPKIFVNSWRDDYREMTMDAYAQMGIGEISWHSDFLDVDHALAKSVARGRYNYVLMNPVSQNPNRTFGGGIERASKHRKFKDQTLEFASIIELLKIAEISPVTKRNLAEDCLVGIIQAKEGGLIRGSDVRTLINSIRHSDNNLVADAYLEVKTDFDMEANKIFDD